MRLYALSLSLFGLFVILLLHSPHSSSAAPAPNRLSMHEDVREQTGDATDARTKEVIAKELETWELEKKKDKLAYAALMAPDYIAVTSRGLMNTALNLQEIDDMTFEGYSATDIKVRFLAKDVALITYKVAWKAQSRGKRFEENDYTAAIWSKHGDKWLDEFYQETAILPPNSPQFSGGKQEEPSPTGKLPAPDPRKAVSKSPLANLLIAKERLGWAHAKKKDKPSYAALLGTDFILVSETGVMNKTQNVEDLDNLQIDDYALTDFRVNLIRNDLALLTYRVTARGVYREKPYNSVNYAGSVWAKRDGQWLNVFFQETGVAPTNP